MIASLTLALLGTLNLAALAWVLWSRRACAARTPAKPSQQGRLGGARLKRLGFEALIETLPDLVWLKDPEGVFLYCNRRFSELYGHPQAEILGKTDYDFVEPELADFFRRHDQRALRHDGPMVNEEWVTFASDGHAELLETTKTPLYGPEGEVIGVLGIAHDVTARKQNEDTLRKLSFAVEQSGSVVIVTNQALEIEYVNQAFCHTTGYTKEEALGRNPRFLQSGRTPPETYREMWAALAAGQPWRGQFINRRKDGEEYCEAAFITPLHDEGGQLTHYVALKDDVTEKNRLDAELEEYRLHLEELVQTRTRQFELAKQQSEAANEAKSRFLANITHEIRTPMNAIMGFVQLLGEEIQDRRQRERLDKIMSASAHLLGILNDVLDLSKIEASRLELEEVPFSPADLLEQAADLIRERVTQQGLQLVLECDRAFEDAWVAGDPLRVRQILLNYLSNAVKFTQRGRITLRALFSPSGQGRADLRFEVQDTGIGLRPEDEVRVFDAFEQAQASTTREYGGTGLGLAISRRLAKLMGGEVGVESVYGAGSTFSLDLHLPIVSAPAPRLRPPSSKLLRSAKVLLVEDDEVNREVVSEVLQRFGLQVEAAVNGQEACDKVDAARFDLVLMDIQMPVMDGIEATRRIRAMPGRGGLPILAMTANVLADDRRRYDEVGMNDLLPKPVHLTQIRSTLRRWLPGSGQPEAAGATAAPGAATQEARPAPRAGARAGPLADRKLLLVEDDPINRELLSEVLASFGARVDVATNGGEACRLASSTSHDLILMDLNMPGMGGLEATRRLRRLGNRTLILAMSASALEEDRRRCEEAGLDGFIAKPIRLDALRATLRGWLERTTPPLRRSG